MSLSICVLLFCALDNTAILSNCCFVISGTLILVAIGIATVGNSYTDKCQVLNMSSTSTTCASLQNYPVPTALTAGGVVNGAPTICGGYRINPNQPTESCYYFNKFTNSWKFLSNMNTFRYHHSSTVVKDALFVTGGHGSGGMSASTEFLYSNGTTQNGPDMPLARIEHCMVTLHDGRVMILGAWSPSSLRKNVIIMDPADNTYTTGPSMTYERMNAGCTIFNSPLHNDRPVVVIAGGNGQSTAEVYDYTNANQWQTSIHIIIYNI